MSLSESDGEYIPEDHETESRRNRRMALRIQTAILQNLRQTLGVAGTLPEEAAKDLMLQVNVLMKQVGALSP